MADDRALRGSLTRLASELPPGDETRRKLLVALSDKTAISDWTVSNSAATLKLVAGNFIKSNKKSDPEQIRMLKANTKSAMGALASVMGAVGDTDAQSAIEQAMTKIRL